MPDYSSLAESLALLSRGGPVMAALLFVAILAVAIILVKFYQFMASRIRRTDFIEPVLAMVREGAHHDALHFLAHTRSPVARVMEVTIDVANNSDMSPADREAEIRRVGAAQLRGMESYLRGLEVIGNLSPLLGLLGTVIGMIKAFARLETAGTRVDPGILAGGIWEALLTTAVGLIIAIPVVGAYHILEAEVDHVRGMMSDLSTRLLTFYGYRERRAAAALEAAQ